MWVGAYRIYLWFNITNLFISYATNYITWKDVFVLVYCLKNVDSKKNENNHFVSYKISCNLRLRFYKTSSELLFFFLTFSMLTKFLEN